MGSWVEEFNTFQTSASPGIGGNQKNAFPRKQAKQPQSRTEKINAELKLLEWHKLANDAALKAALMQTKQLKGIEEPDTEKQHKDQAKWVRKIVTNEQTKPLEVSKDFVLEYEAREVESADRLSNQVERHIDTLKVLRGKLESKLDVQSRSHEYREWKKDFTPIKNAVLNGKTLSDTEKRALTPNKNETTNQSTFGMDKHTRGATKELATVLDSLNKLAELENRITSLEIDNVYDKMKEDEVASQQQQQQLRTALEFKKKMANDPLKPGSVRTVYSINQKRIPLMKSNQRSNMSYNNNNKRGRGGKKVGNTFITANEQQPNDADQRREAAMRERQRQLALASNGQKHLRARVQTRKIKIQSDQLANAKHEEALSELQKRRREQNAKTKARNSNFVLQESKGAAAGRKYKNQHLEEFHQMKKEHRAKKEERRYNNDATSRNVMVSSSAPLPDINKKSRQQGSNNPASYTAHNDGSGNKRKPLTKTSGTVTRRGDGKKPSGASGHDGKGQSAKQDGGFSMPPIVGSGFGGARALKNNNNHG